MSAAPVRNPMLGGALIWKMVVAAVPFGGCLDTGYVLRAADASTEAGQAGEAGAAGNANGGAGADSPPLASGCDRPFLPGTDFAVCRAGAWGKALQARLLAVDIDRAGYVLLGGQTPASDPGDLTLTPAGTGLLERTDAIGQTLARVRLGNRVNDLALLDDSVVVATDQGVTRLSSDLQHVLGDQPIGEVLRVAASVDGVLTAGAGGRVRWFGADLTEQGELPLTGVTIEDVAVDQASGLRIVTGSQLPPTASQCQGSLPFIRAFDAQAKLAWSAYDLADPLTWCASSTGKRLAVQQGKLYYAGEQNGGNSVHLRDPRDASTQAALVSYDEFSTGAGKAIETYSFVARFDLATGAFETGQVIVPRNAGSGGTLSTFALAVDEAGRIFLGGQITCCLERRDERRVGGTLLGPYAGPEASLLILSPDLRERLAWTSFTDVGGPADSVVRAVAVRSGLGVLGATLDGSAQLVTVPQAQETQLAAGGYVVTFPAP